MSLWRRIAFGLKNGPPHFQRTTNTLIKDAKVEDHCVGFVDDYGMGDNSIDDNIANLTKLFNQMRDVNYKLGADKLWLGYKSITFLGFLLKDG
jgi:hypothetical protein